MAAHLQQSLKEDPTLFDVPLQAESEPPWASASLPAGVGNRAFVDDVGFEDILPERRSTGSASPRPERRTRGADHSEQDYGSVRRAPIPVPTISQGMQMPYSGIQLLAGVEAVEIHQTVELEDLLSSVESENRYVVRSAAGETLLVAAECSSECQRQCLGSRRAMRLRLYDPSRQESLHLSRRLACGTGPFGLMGCCFYLQSVEVLLPPGRPLGSVRQVWTLLVPVLEVRDLAGGVLYRIEGPGPRPWACTLKEAVFKITSRDGLVELGVISHQWKQSLSSYITRVIFPNAELNVNHKALLLAAAFLLEYMYFESAKKKTWIIPCCC